MPPDYPANAKQFKLVMCKFLLTIRILLNAMEGSLQISAVFIKLTPLYYT